MELNKEKLMNNYEIIEQIGSGIYGTVYKAIKKINGNNEGKIIALKKISITPLNEINEIEKIEKRNKQITSVKEEIEYLKTLSVPNCNMFVSCYYDSFFDEENSQFLIEMEYVDGIDMRTFISTLKKTKPLPMVYYYLLLITKDLALGLKYIHDKNILHNDLKLENIMIDKNNTPRIIDFGLSCFTRNSSFYGKSCDKESGTPYYLPPEFFNLRYLRLPASDMWALGVVLYKAITGKYPYNGSSYEDLYDNIIEGDSPPLTTSNKLLNTIVERLLTKNWKYRHTADDIINLLSDVVLAKQKEIAENGKIETIKENTKNTKKEDDLMRIMNSLLY